MKCLAAISGSSNFLWCDVVRVHQVLPFASTSIHRLLPGRSYIRQVWKAYYVLFMRPSDSQTKVKTSVSAFTGDNRMKQRMYEGCVPIEHVPACLKELHQWLQAELKIKGGVRRNLNVFMRVVEAEDIWLSPTYVGRGVYLSIIEFL